MKTDEALDRLIEQLGRIEQRLDSFEGRLCRLEEAAAPVPPPAAAAPAPQPAGVPPPEGQLRQDTFGPAVHRASAAGHRNAVNKALGMLGLVPDRDDGEEKQRSSLRHKHALNKALEMLGVKRAVPEPAPEPVAPPAAVTEPAPQAEPAAQVVPEASGAALEIPEGTAEEIVPLPELEMAARPADDDAAGVDVRPVDLHEALAVDLEHPSSRSRDHAVPILNAVVVAAAAGAALYAGGVLGPEGVRTEAWRELASGVGAALCGGIAFFARRLSIHLRAFLGGAAALLLHALAFLLLAPRAPIPPALPLGVAFLASLAGLLLVARTAHPLALFLGFGGALALPHWLAPDPDLFLPYAAVLNLATVYAALHLRRPQASVAAAALTVPLALAAANHPALASFVGLCAAVWFAQVVLAPLLDHQMNRGATLLAVFAFGFGAWAVHGLWDTAGWPKAGALAGMASVAALAAGLLRSREDLLRGVLKAGAALLLLSALPAGVRGAALAPVTVGAALLLALFALLLGDAFLRAVGALTLVAASVLVLRDGGDVSLLLGIAATATVLTATRARPEPAALPLVLSGVAHGAALLAVARVVPASFVATSWLLLGLIEAVLARRFRVRPLASGAALSTGAGAVGALLIGGPAPWQVAVGAALVLPHRWLARPRGARGLYLFTGKLLALGALQLALPGPAGVLAALPALALLALAARGDGRRQLQARALVVLLLVRCLAPDVWFAPAAHAWLNLRSAALLAAVVAGLAVVRRPGPMRAPAAALACALLAAAVYAELQVPALALVAALLCGGLCHFLAGGAEPAAAGAEDAGPAAAD